MILLTDKGLRELVDHLKQENQELKQLNDKLQDAYFKLVEELLPKKSVIVTAPVPKKIEHSMTRIDGHAKCSCGWEIKCEDPIELQNEISAHYAKQRIQPRKKGIGPFREVAEAQAEREAREKAKKENIQ